ncbi:MULTISPECIES: AMP-binding protein [unclassified Microbacterium]|uniref:AMP-binding protein n=1 Tax=unclassified Microbacterium TaxID=2609290 RepID=UPI0012FA717A|nr:AMP-binding protein [Microbacterium sp. MAH-37]MVQ42709.1 AMP-binding protein [Microbacterium sp. MAH-37]
MTTLHPIGTDARAVQAALPAALDGTAPLALGFAPDAGDAVPAGTAVVIATSGSSGIPKRVVLSGAALRASGEATAARIGEGQWMLALPAGYVAGLQVLARSLAAGQTPARLDGRFTPKAFIEATSELTAERKYTSLVPAQLATLLDAAPELPAVRTALAAYDAILIGGQSLPGPLRERAADAGARIVRTYGSSETAGGCVYDGVPLGGVTVTVRAGELQITGPTLADGYLGDPDLTERTFVHVEDTRWYRTGDAGEVSDAGVVAVHGRIDNVIVSGGINISLDRVERVVRGVTGLEHAAVVGVEDERWGEASVVVAPRPAAPDATQDLLSLAREAVGAAIGAPARPSRLVLLDDFPVLASGKPDRQRLRRMLDVPDDPVIA